MAFLLDSVRSVCMYRTRCGSWLLLKTGLDLLRTSETRNRRGMNSDVPSRACRSMKRSFWNEEKPMSQILSVSEELQRKR